MSFRMFQLSAGSFNAAHLDLVAQQMAKALSNGGGSVDSGYVYLGQFVSHDLVNARGTPSGIRAGMLDLEPVYGQVLQHLPEGEKPDPVKLARIYNAATGELLLGADGHDLPRDAAGKALVMDGRSDQNLLASQLHLQFMKLHNHLVRVIGSQYMLSPLELFKQARHELILLYQEVVLHDLLRTVLDARVWQHVIQNGAGVLPQQAWVGVPVEFVDAAFRFGHSMVRSSYTINRALSLPTEQLFEMPGPNGAQTVPGERVVDWRHFFQAMDVANRFVNRAEQIGPALSVRPPEGSALAIRDLRASKELPTAQDCIRLLQTSHPRLAKIIGLELLNKDQLNPPIGVKRRDEHGAFDDGERPWRSVPKGHTLADATPLGYYILVEALATHQGARLGPLGSLIVAESLREAIRMSSPSILPVRTETRRIQPSNLQSSTPYLRMVDLLRAVNPQKTPIAAAATSTKGPSSGGDPESVSKPKQEPASPEQVLQRFIGKFRSTGEWDRGTTGRDKDAYYPRAGVELEFYRVPIRNAEKSGAAYAKVTITGAPNMLPLEAAIYRVEGDKLVAKNIEIEPGMLVDEELTFTEDGGMKHYLRYSDGSNGSWICRIPPK
jgi:hypothetical protein